MRQTAFFSLLQAGYIGANASDASHLRALVEAVASGGDALVVAVQRETSSRESELDRQRLLRMYEDEESGYH